MCSHKKVKEYRPTYFNDFGYNHSAYRCISCNTLFKSKKGENPQPVGSKIIKVEHTNKYD